MLHRTLLISLATTASLFAQATPCHAEFATTNNYLTGWTMGGILVAIKTTVTTAIVPTRLEFFTGLRTGACTVHIYAHDPAGNQPAALLCSGSFTEVAALGWQGGNLSPVLPILPNTTIWVAWDPIGGDQVPTEGHNASTPPAGAQEYRASSTGSAPWTGPFRQHQWKFRIFCGGQMPGAYAPFGKGCVGSNAKIPAIAADTVPTLGLPIQIRLSGGLASTPAFCAVGTSDKTWGSLQLPYDLGAIGGPGCSAYVDMPVLLATATNAAGDASLPLQIPNNPGLFGQLVFNQWVVLDPAANNLHATVSNAGKATIGN